MATHINTEVKGISRREFLTYLWGASAVLLVAEAGGAAVWFALRHYRSESDSGLFHIDPSIVPAIDADPIPHPDGKFWLANTSKGLFAFSMFCTFRVSAFFIII